MVSIIQIEQEQIKLKAHYASLKVKDPQNEWHKQLNKLETISSFVTANMITSVVNGGKLIRRINN